MSLSAELNSRTRFLRACRGESVDRVPVWIMRQAGRYLSAYRAIREKHAMMTVLNTPELAVQVTLLPVDTFDLDAAIIFADLLPPLIGMGLSVEFVPGKGPVIHNPLRTNKAIDRLSVPPAEETMAPTLEAIRLVRPELNSREMPLIGFAGAPFTLASYAIEGGATRDFAHTKTLMYHEPAAWNRLMLKLVGVVVDLLKSQVGAGADCVQVFDSWAGALGRYDYQRFVQPYSRMVFEQMGNAVPVIHFSTGTSAYLDLIAAAGGHVIGVDWRMDLDAAQDIVQRPVMGNLDPGTLLGPWRELRPHVDDVLTHMHGRGGHVFNLGHGILPNTPVDNVRRMVDYVHSGDWAHGRS